MCTSYINFFMHFFLKGNRTIDKSIIAVFTERDYNNFKNAKAQIWSLQRIIAQACTGG